MLCARAVNGSARLCFLCAHICDNFPKDTKVLGLVNCYILRRDFNIFKNCNRKKMKVKAAQAI